MNKEELVKEISKKTKLSQKVSSDVLSATLEIIQKTVAKGKKVTLEYEERYKTFFWWGDTRYFVTKVSLEK